MKTNFPAAENFVFISVSYSELTSQSSWVTINYSQTLAHTGLSTLQGCNTYGSFILMNTLHVKKDTRTQTKPRNSKRNLFSLDMPTALDLSKIMKPSPPMENRKLDAKPSMMYWPFTRYGMKATCEKYTRQNLMSMIDNLKRSKVLQSNLNRHNYLNYAVSKHWFVIPDNLQYNFLASKLNHPCSYEGVPFDIFKGMGQ